MDTNPKKEEEFETSLKKSYKKSIIIALAIVLTLVIIWFLIENSKYQSTDDAYIETHTVQVAPKASGHIKEVFITDNQKVKKGDLVAIIDDTDYKVQFERANAAYEAALLRQTNAKANFNASNSNIELAKKNLERYTELYEKGAVSKLDYDNAKLKYDTAQAQLVQAEENVLSDGSGKRVADADLKQLEALKKQAELNLSYTRIYAPQDGSIAKKAVEIGAYVRVGQSLFAIVPDKVWVIANFKESQVGKMKAGQVVDIKVDAYRGKTFKGRVDSIQRASGAKSSLFPPENAVGSFVKIVQRIPVKIVFDEEVDETVYSLIPGMSVIPKVRVK